jgi:hypothetical protein
MVLTLMNVAGDYLQVKSELDDTLAHIERLIALLPADAVAAG